MSSEQNTLYRNSLTQEEQQGILASIIAAVSLAALAMVISNSDAQIPSTYKTRKLLGKLIILSVWMSSILILVSSLWKHFLDKKHQAISRRDLFFYVSTFAVLTALVITMLWLSFSFPFSSA